MWTLSVLKIFLNNPSVEQAVKTEAIFVQQRDLVKIGMILIIRMILRFIMSLSSKVSSA